MIPIHITSGSGVPSYRQIVDQVKYLVASKGLKPGDSLPSIRELARQLSVNPSTIVKAYNDLAHEGIVERRPGKGVFINDEPPQLNNQQAQQTLVEQARKLAVEARQLGLEPEQVIEILKTELENLDDT